MIEFRKLELDDKALIQSFFNKASIPICDYSFSTIFTWRNKFKSEFAIFNDFLIIRYHNNRHYEYLFPIGNGDLMSCVTTIIAYAEQHNEVVIFGSVLPSMYNSQLDFFNDKFLFVPNRDNWEYVYETKHLIELKGKSFQPKRNFINRFQKLYPNYFYKKIEDSDVENCMRLYDEWYDCHKHAGNIQDIDDERDSINEVFSHYHSLDFDGVCLYVDEVLVAFAVGSKISSDMYIEHIEKANPAYEGAYTMINNLFAQMVSRDYGCDYINREEDMGLPTLRKAKLQYNPSGFLKKGCLVLKNNPFVDIAIKEDVPEIKLLWKRIFEDEDEYIEGYFNQIFPESISLVIKQNSHVISSLQLIPYEYVCEGKSYSTYYVYAVMTDDKFRNQGYMTVLINLAKQIAEINGKDFLFLVPDDSKDLRGFYQKFGFFNGFKYVSNKTFFKSRDLDIPIDELYRSYLAELTDNGIKMAFYQFDFELKNYIKEGCKEHTFEQDSCQLDKFCSFESMVCLLNKNLSVEKIKLANGGLLMTD